MAENSGTTNQTEAKTRLNCRSLSHYISRYLETQLWEFPEKVQHVQSINIFISGFFLEFLQSCGHMNWVGVLQCIFPIPSSVFVAF